MTFWHKGNGFSLYFQTFTSFISKVGKILFPKLVKFYFQSW